MFDKTLSCGIAKALGLYVKGEDSLHIRKKLSVSHSYVLVVTSHKGLLCPRTKLLCEPRGASMVVKNQFLQSIKVSCRLDKLVTWSQYFLDSTSGSLADRCLLESRASNQFPTGFPLSRRDGIP